MSKDRKRGFIGLIIMLVFALAFAKYLLHWNILDLIKSPKFLEVLTYIKKFILIVWNTILVKPATFLWNKVIVGIMWKTIVLGYELLRHWVDSKG